MSDFITEVVNPVREEILEKYTGTEKIVKIPEGITEIKNSAFEGTDIEEVVFPESLADIDRDAFRDCKNLKRISFPKIPIYVNHSFGGCDSLEELFYPLTKENEKSRQSYKFNYCENLKKITYPEGSKIMMAVDFRGCNKLETIILPASLLHYKADIFADMDHPFRNLESIEIHPDNEVFCMQGKYFMTKNGKKILATLKGLDGDIIVPEGVESINPHAFEEKDEITSFALPESLKAIGCAAFSGCTSIKSISIPDSVSDIGCMDCNDWGAVGRAFCNCTSLVSVKLPSSLKIILQKTFFNCSSLKTVTIPDGVEAIYFRAFANCTSLEEIVIPNSVKKIDEGTSGYVEGVFENCTSLKTVKIGDGLKEVPARCFAKCKNLTTVELSNNVKKICKEAFAGCKNLKEIKIPKDTIVLKSSFRGCKDINIQYV